MFANAAVGLMLVPFLIGQFGREGYGLVTLVVAMVSMSTIVDLGLRGSLGRLLAEQVALDDVRRFNELASTALMIYVIAGLALASMCAFLSADIARVFKVPVQHATEAEFVIIGYGALGILLTYVSAVFEAVLASKNRFDISNYTQAAIGLVRAALIVGIVFITDWGLRGWAVAMVVAMSVSLVLLFVGARRVCPELSLRWSAVRRQSLVSLITLGGHVFILQLTALLGIRADPLILSALLGTSAVALYAPAASLVGAVRPLVETLSQQLYPLATGYHVRGQVAQLRELLLRGTRYTLLMGIPVSVTIAVYAERICSIWLGDKLGADFMIVAKVLTLWAIIDFFNYAGGGQYPTLLGMNKLRFLVLLEAPLALLNILGSIALVKYTELGVVGVVVPTVAFTALRRPLTAAYTARVCGLSVAVLFNKSYLRPLLMTGILALSAFGLRSWFHPESLQLLLLCITMNVLLWAALCWVLGFDREDRAIVVDMKNRLGRHLGR